MAVFEIIGRRLVALCPSLHNRGRANRGDAWLARGSGSMPPIDADRDERKDMAIGPALLI